MSKDRWFGILIAAVFAAVGFLATGLPILGFICMFVAVVSLVFFRSVDGQRSSSILQGISSTNYEELQAAVNRRRESEIRLQAAERGEIVRSLVNQMDMIQQEQQRGRPGVINIPDDIWMGLYREQHPEDVIREALRLRQTHTTPIARFGGLAGRWFR
jgi:hypothetical protein